MLEVARIPTDLILIVNAVKIQNKMHKKTASHHMCKHVHVYQ